MTATIKKKLIEVALPLDAINAAAAHEKMPGIGAHPRGVHMWWARRPLATCRAVLFASIVDDPSSHPERFPTIASQDEERERLHNLIARIVPWAATRDEALMNEARAEIVKATGGNPPAVYDPFCGGGSIPLEAQRLGLESIGSDLNPVPVLITKALIDIPARFANQHPVNPRSKRAHLGTWKGAQGLAEDVRYYGEWIRREAENRIGSFYPSIQLPKKFGGGQATVLAWLWTRTVKCPNPACGCRMPLVKSFALSTKKGKEASVAPVIDRETTPPTIRFEVHDGPASQPGTVGRQGAHCIACGSSVTLDHIRKEGQGKRLGQTLMAIVAEGSRTRYYLPPTIMHEERAFAAIPAWTPTETLPEQALGFRIQNYGLTQWSDLFTNRQLLALETFGILIGEIKSIILEDINSSPLIKDNVTLDEGGNGATAYAEAISVYLAFTISRISDFGNTCTRWASGNQKVMNLFSKQAIQMSWDFSEANFLANVVGGWETAVEFIADCIETLPCGLVGNVNQVDATQITRSSVLFSSDPPYYDNVPYADLSDFFYIWLKKSLASVYPNLLGTLKTPKQDELVADPFRYGSRELAFQHFEAGMTRAFSRMAGQTHPDFPITLYYAFKQQESEQEDEELSIDESMASSGWETFLAGLVGQGLEVVATWPMRTEQTSRTRSLGSNALASSIVLVCRPRPQNSRTATRREFLQALRLELPESMRLLQKSHIAPVDLAQAAIGPGMAIYSRYKDILESSGQPMAVRTALQLINKALDDFLTEQEGDFDADSRWAITWFEQRQFMEGPYGDAETLSKARNTSVDGLVEAGILWSKAGKVRLLNRSELDSTWDPTHDSRLTVWEALQHLIRVLESDGETAAGRLMAKLGSMGDTVRELAYRLYALCERKKWSQEAQAYNGLIVSWGAVQAQAIQIPRPPTATTPRLIEE